MNPIGGSKLYIGLRVAGKSEVTATDFEGQDWLEIGGLTNIGQLSDSQEVVSQSIISGGRTRQTKGTVVGQVMENTFIPDWSDPGQQRFLAAMESCSPYAFKVEWSEGCEDDPTVDLFYGLAMPGSRAGGDANTAQLRSWAIAVDSNITPGGGFPVPATQPSNWAMSWHEDMPLVSRDDLTVTLMGTGSNGSFVAMQADRATGAFLKKQTYTPLISTQDDHNAFSEVALSSGVNLRAQCGHGNAYQVGAVKNEIRVFRSLTGTFEGFASSLDRADAVVITLPSADRPNYIQFHQIAAGAFAGRVLLWYNDDTTVSWRCYFSDDDGATWTRGRMLFASIALGQVYMRIDPAGIFTGALPGSGYNSTFLPFYGFNHTTNSNVVLSYSLIDLENGQVRRPDTGALAASGASIFDQTNQDTFITSLGATENAMRRVRARLSGTGRSQRTHMVHAGIAYLTDFTADTDPSPFTDIRHIVHKAGVDYDLGSAGVTFWPQSAYNPDIQPAREPHSGDRIYRCYNDGTAYNSGSKLDRIDYAGGLAAGSPTTTNILEAGVTPGIAADEAIMRYFPVKGAQATGLVGWAWVGKYTSTIAWTGCRFVPVVI